jgi:hypothetical protein
MKKLALILINFTVVLSMYSQGIINNGARIAVTTGTKVIVSGGGFTNLSSGSFHGLVKLDGTMTLSGQWTNNAVSGYALVNSTGRVVFNSLSTQSIGGSSSTAFAHLTLSNTGTKNVTLSTTVNGNLIINSSVPVNIPAGVTFRIGGNVNNAGAIINGGTILNQ